ncbi:hypothetical protein DFP74_3485 [Nocardiopsis sp. Huas11]|uniref:hypothetical protein n=1 Tax=Nocardiopsis sp. Huas11 TaxID=2183912 RepID=UPI000EB15076|nr:hypothetical protein [Nocardiopsis sp. Huas11]RKS07801.1 hypothetical protein DFP74_3485 [Nocardiopsis sp. Huas11]
MTDFVLQPTQEGELRRRVLFWVPLPLPVLGAVALAVGGTMAAAGWTILLAACVGVGSLLLALVVQPTPLPEGLTPPVSARRSLHRFRQFTNLRVVLALVPVVVGAMASLIGGGLYPLLACLALAWPQLLLALPTFFTITRARRAMEAWGTTAYLWHALSRPARVTWPVVTPLVRLWREWRKDRARLARTRAVEDRRQREREREWKRVVDEESRDTDQDGDASPRSALEHTRPVRPLPGHRFEDQERTDVVPQLGARPDRDAPEPDRTGRQEADQQETDQQETELLPHLGAAQETDPTRVMPHLDGSDAENADRAPSAPTGGRSSVHRAALQFLERGSDLGMAVRRRRRGAPSTRRPRSHKP